MRIHLFTLQTLFHIPLSVPLIISLLTKQSYGRLRWSLSSLHTQGPGATGNESLITADRCRKTGALLLTISASFAVTHAETHRGCTNTHRIIFWSSLCCSFMTTLKAVLAGFFVCRVSVWHLAERYACAARRYDRPDILLPNVAHAVLHQNVSIKIMSLIVLGFILSGWSWFTSKCWGI